MRACAQVPFVWLKHRLQRVRLEIPGSDLVDVLWAGEKACLLVPDKWIRQSRSGFESWDFFVGFLRAALVDICPLARFPPQDMLSVSYSFRYREKMPTLCSGPKTPKPPHNHTSSEFGKHGNVGSGVGAKRNNEQKWLKRMRIRTVRNSLKNSNVWQNRSKVNIDDNKSDLKWERDCCNQSSCWKTDCKMQTLERWWGKLAALLK